MILKTLTLRNFRKFKNTTIEFPDGVTGIIGLNGVGKSTIFEAVAWVLYGPVAARTPAEQIKRENAQPDETCRVELEFILEGNIYRIIREMKGKNLTANATATCNGKIAATNAEPVTKYIQKTLGMDFKSFFTSIFARQKELNALSTMNASERRPLILRMLGIDSLDDIIREIKTDKKTKDSLISKLESDLIDENGENRIELYKKEVEKLKKTKNENLQNLKKIKEKIKTFEKQLKNLEKQKQDNQKNYEKIREKKEQLQEQKTQYENKTKIMENVKTLNDKIKQRMQNIEKQKTKNKQYENIDSEIGKTEKKFLNVENEIENIIKNIEQKKTLLDRTNNDIKETQSKQTKIEQIGPDANVQHVKENYKNNTMF